MRSGYFPINRRLHRERESERPRERERLCPSVKWWKHGNSTISIIQGLDISQSIKDCIEREKESKREREAMSICETVKTQKWYYIHNSRSAYFPINRRLHRESKREREREQEKEREWTDSLSGHFIWNVNSYMISVCTSSWSLHLTTLGGGKSYSLSGYFIWKFWLISETGHFIWQVLVGHIWQLIWEHQLKIWTHFRFYSCFTEVFSMKDQ